MQPRTNFQVALLWRTDAEKPANRTLSDNRLALTAQALERVGLSTHAAPYSDESVDEVQQQLKGMHAVLVWVNPLENDKDRTTLNALLRDLSDQGVYVSAHPDVIDKMGTKEVLVQTKHMSWGSDTHLYNSIDQFRKDFPVRCVQSSPRVLKRNRGCSGKGVWTVELADLAHKHTIHDSSREVFRSSTRLRVRHAIRGSKDEIVTWQEFENRITPYFAESGAVIDQPYQTRLAEGMIRCYLVNNRVVGFGHQQINALLPANSKDLSGDPPLPGPRIYHGSEVPEFQPIKLKMETEWLQDLLIALGINDNELPVIWDADLMLGSKDQKGIDTYVLCEINVSSVYPFPDQALEPMAMETLRQLQRTVGN